MVGLGAFVLGSYMALFLRAGDRYQIPSSVLNETRIYSVYLPSGYVPATSYPVLYSLDGEKYRHGAIVAANARMMAALGLAPDRIVVAVHTMGQRGRDYRPSHGAAAFTDFLEKELLPEVARTLPTTGKHVLSGHSFGGLYTLYVMTTRPHLFEAYFAYDPSVLPDEELLDRLVSLAKAPPNKALRLYMNYGFHSARYEKRYSEVLEIIEGELAGKVVVKSSYFPLPHSMIMLPGQVQAMAFEGPLRAVGQVSHKKRPGNPSLLQSRI